MVRNLILLISTMAVLLLLFVGYSLLAGAPEHGADAPTNVAAPLPAPVQVADDGKLQIGGVEVPPGEWMKYVEYGRDGRPTDSFACESWAKVPGTKNDVLVTRPELMMRLPSGMIVTVTAARGQISAERADTKRVQPKCGWLEGNARIVVDRETSFERTPLSERPEDRITIAMERLAFDLELGELKTDEPLRVTSPEFEITGTGLHLIWNQPDNRVETLVIKSGGQMVLKGELLGVLDGATGEQEPAGGQPATTRPARPATSAFTRKDRTPTAYRCVFSDGVSVDHYVGEQRTGGLRADELVLLFDVGGQGRGLSRRDTTTATAPASQPIEAGPPKRLVVQWNGQLALGPAQKPPAPGQSRRRFEARGRPVIVALPNNGSVRCGRLILHEETKRLWLYAADDGEVHLSSADKLSVRATGMFVDLESRIVKLLGEVRFESSTGAGQSGQALTIRCNLWAELHLAGDRDRNTVKSVFDNPLASRPPESAAFVGEVRVEYEDQRLEAHRLDARFRQPGESAERDALLEGTAAGPGKPREQASALQAMLESAVATGDVKLTVGDSSASRGWRQVLERHADVLERALVRSLSKTAQGRSRGRARHADRTLECARLRLDFALVDGEVRVRQMEGTGAVAIFDRDSRFAARGRRVAATFAGREEIERAAVSGTAEDPALVRARAYTLAGKEIKVDNRARTLHVDGWSKLAFRSRRSFQGRTRRRPETITVTSNESLHIDEQENTVHFIGQVAAGTGNEKLLADALTLLLEDVEEAGPRTAWSQLKGVVRLVRGELFGESEARREPGSILNTRRSRGGDRKELARILAQNAVLQSETYAPGDELPLVHQSIAAPELESDPRQRWIRTSGETTLLMTDRRLPSGAEPARSALGIPSALMTRGPSQTAMKCSRSLLYVLGEEGPERKDSVLFEGAVRFRHVAGREMVNLEQMLPEVVADPELLKKLKSRNTYMECDRFEGIFAVADEPRAVRGGRGLRPSLQLAWLNARGNVYLRDQQNTAIRTVYAHQLEFDRPNGVIRVLGLPEQGIEARVYDEDPVTGRFNIPAIGPEIIINLGTSTIKTKEIRGQAGG